MHDTLVKVGEDVPRVAHYLAGRDSWTLRADLETMAMTGRAPKRLGVELMAYSTALVDETAVEAVHRDVSRHGTRAT